MDFEFSKNLQGFTPTGNQVEISRMIYQQEPVLYCRCKDPDRDIGVIRQINLPNLTQYALSVIGESNNNRTYLTVTDVHDRPLSNNLIYFKKDKLSTLKLKFYGRTAQIKIKILMGGDSIAGRKDSFLLRSIKLSPVDTNQTTTQSTLKITRKFDTVPELEKELDTPMRSNKTPMEIGEYAILSNSDKPDDLYILGQNGLKHVCRINSGLPSFFGQALNPIPGRVIPIYQDSTEAQIDLERNPERFYHPKGDYSWTINSEQLQQINKDQNFDNPNNKEINDNKNLYLYLDSQGYVRWLKY